MSLAWMGLGSVSELREMDLAILNRMSRISTNEEALTRYRNIKGIPSK